jgi:crotonobetainyl-CoA:carnitine CoA-transferase CaiB-like acyl-CoA transferase
MRTGEPQYVEVPMFECIANFNLVEHLCNATFVPPTGQWGYARQLDPTRQPMPTKDGYISIAPYLPDRWIRFFQVAGHPEVLEDPRLRERSEWFKNMWVMYEAAEKIMPERTTDEWLALLKEANVPATRVNEIDDLLKDPQLNASGLLREREHPTEGRYVEVRQPVRFGGFDLPELSHAAARGQHTADLETELGIGSDR